VYEFELKKELCTKQLRMLDRDVEAHASWVGVASVPDASASLNVSAGLSALASGGLAGAVSGAVSFDADAPAISAATLRQEVYDVDRNVWQDGDVAGAGVPSLSLWAGIGVGAGPAGVSGAAQLGVGAPPAPPAAPGQTDDATTAKRLAMELDRARRKYQLAAGRSDCRRLGAGYRFSLGKHPVGMLNGEYTVTALEVEGTHPDFLADGDAVYRNRFRCVPSSVAPRPKRPKRRPKPGMEVARVVGFVGAESLPGLEANGAGYVRVRFRWDIVDDEATDNGSLRIGTDDVHSVWLPVVQPWAGAGYGAQFIPREGMEVLVGFMEDQTERPVILGCLYSDRNKPPWDEYIDHQRIGIRSQTRPMDGGYSEISIDDRRNAEVVRVRAQRDLDVTVLRESRTTVKADHITTVHGGMNAHVLRDRTEHIDGSSTTLIRGSETTKVDGSVSTRVGGVVDRQVGGNDSARIDGSLKVSVRADARFETAGSRTTSVGRTDSTTIGDRHAVTVGAAGNAAAESDMYVWGTYRMGAKKRLTIDSETEIVFRCGTSELHLKPDGISLSAKSVDASAAKQLSLSGSGPSLTLGDDATMTSKKITLQTTGARLSMSDSAALTSSSVQLGKPTQLQPPSSKSAPTNPNTFGLVALGPDHSPLANCKYLLELGGVTTEGTTDASGTVTGSPPAGVTTGRCTVWISDFPEGPRVTIDISLEALEPASDVKGAQKRLRNLGYYTGQSSGELSHHLRDAVLVFQLTHSLPRTGLLDDPTVAKLAEVHP
jgi:type VI secretion system secreted protein VgrG